jgi:hypothetical protein
MKLILVGSTLPQLFTPPVGGAPAWRIAEQHFFTDGQIVIVGDGHKRQKGKKSDYLLRYEKSFPIAVVEAKDEGHEPAAGLQQAKDYALILGLFFAYSTNGPGVRLYGLGHPLKAANCLSSSTVARPAQG